jgi:uncharacterized YigZ family protein
VSPPPRFLSLAERVEHEIDPIKKSRFIGLAVPVSSEEDALAVVEEAKARWHDARHHCWAYRLADGRVRSSDDGEPGGSAGRPILAHLEGHEVHDVVVVVTRYFGGTKLGVGGLIRAYGGTAGKTLDRGAIVEVASRVTLRITHGYDDTGAVEAVLRSRGLVDEVQWGQDVRRVVSVEVTGRAELVAALRDATAGRVVAEG